MAELRNKVPDNIRAMADVVPTSLNEEERTVEVVFGTDTPVRMWDWDMGDFMESMSFEDGHVRWTRFENGAPVLDNHDRYAGAKGVLGVIKSFRTEAGKGIATLRFSKRDSVTDIFNDIKDGILKGISFGYRVYKYEQTPSLEGELPKLRAIDWEPFEISLAPIQADSNAFIRSDEKNSLPVEIIPLTLPSQRSEEPITSEPTIEEPTMTEQERAADIAKQEAEARVRKEAEKTAAANEKARIREIGALCRKFEMEESFEDTLIEDNTSIEAARKLIMDKWEKKEPVVEGNQVRVKADEQDKFRAAVEEGVTMRVDPKKKDAHGGSEFRGMRMLRLAETVLQREGTDTKGMSDNEIARTALNISTRSGQHTTSDFPIILGNTINRQLQSAYAEAPRTFTSWARQSSVSDFRQKTVAKLSGLIDEFKSVPEGGEYESTTMSEDKEAYGVTKFGRMINFSWESLINDDLNAFSRVPVAIANKAAQKQSDIVYAILTGNPVMNDGTALFHANHKNLGTAGAIGATTLKELRKLLRNQKSLSNDFLNLDIATLIVGPDNEEDALLYMNSVIYPTTAAGQNLYKGMANVVVEPRITNKNWFAAASPNMIDTIEYSFLDGEGELFTEQRMGFDVDGLQIKARMVFGAKAIDHRGLYKNPFV